MLASAQRSDRGGRVKSHRQCNVNGVDCGVCDCLFDAAPSSRAGIRRAIGRSTRDEAIEPAARLGLNGGNDALARNVADSGDDPVDGVHRHARINCQATQRSKKPPEDGLVAV